MIKRVIFISNDFGFGPMSRTYTIAKSLKKILPSVDVSIASSGRHDHLFKQDSISFVDINNTRDKSAIGEFLDGYNPHDTLIVSVMNRFAVEVAKKKSFVVLLIDGLYWYWKNRPTEYLVADYEFRCVLPWMLSKYRNGSSKRYYASPVEVEMTNIAPDNTNSKRIILSVNGITTPFYNETHNSYLDFIALVANVIGKSEHISVAGNVEFSEYMITRLDSNVEYFSPDKSTYLKSIAEAKEVILNGGSNSFLEAFWMQKKTAFSLPSNQSQYELIVNLAKATSTTVEYWCPLLSLFPNHSKLGFITTESEAIDYWSNEIAMRLEDETTQKNIVQIIANMRTSENIICRSDSLTRLYGVSAKYKDSTGQIASGIASIISSHE